VKLVLLYFSIEASFVEIFGYFYDMPVICKHVIRVDEYIICNDLKLELRLHLGKDLRKYKG